MSDTDNDSIFKYEITIPETTAMITITKEQIIEDVENRVDRKLSEEEANSVWDDFKHSNDFNDIFCEILREQEIPCQGANGLQYSEYFEEGIKNAIQYSIDEDFSNYWEDFFGNSLNEIAEELKTNNVKEITWDNIESHTQIQIQDENVKNGLARCANELKKTSIKKWKEHYVNTHIINSNIILPNNKNKDDLIKHIVSYFS